MNKCKFTGAAVLSHFSQFINYYCHHHHKKNSFHKTLRNMRLIKHFLMEIFHYFLIFAAESSVICAVSICTTDRGQ